MTTPHAESRVRRCKYVPSGLYAITDPAVPRADALAERVEQVILGGARMVQYRDKSGDQILRRRQAMVLVQLCNRYRVPLIVDDDVDLACDVGAQGVHLGMNDMPLGEARAMLGERGIMGASCYNDFARAERACREGADYIAFGSFFPSSTKPEAVRADVELLRRARRRLCLPICAIGGIAAHNAAPLVRAGADLLAVLSGLFAQPDPRAAAQQLTVLFDRLRPQPGM